MSTRPPAATALVTGATGFLGRALAACLVSRGVRVLALVDDADRGERARSSVAGALAALGHDPMSAELVEPLVARLSDLAELERVVGELELDEVWHLAAHMSYDDEQLAEAVHVNVSASAALMRATVGAGRFYFVSTTGVAGPGSRGLPHGQVPERLLSRFDAVNPYTVSKLLAEHVLWELAGRIGTSLTILRPGSVIGDSLTGWAAGSRHGYYSYLHILTRFRKRDMTYFLDVDPGRRFPVIHVDHLVSLCEALRARHATSDREVFNVCNRDLRTVEQHFDLFCRVAGGPLRVGYGAGVQGFNRSFNALNRDNNRFMGTRLTYATAQLEQTVDEQALPPPLTDDSLTAVFTGALARRP